MSDGVVIQFSEIFRKIQPPPKDFQSGSEEIWAHKTKIA
jgi:hypothetical protein